MNIKIFMAAAVVSLTAACAPTAKTIEIAAGPEAQAALNTAKEITSNLKDAAVLVKSGNRTALVKKGRKKKE